MWGMGVTSLMLTMEMPEACRERMAASLPLPGPRTNTFTWRKPCSIPFRAVCSAALWAAKAVPFREPLKPTVPELPQAITLPLGSVRVILVLLKVDWM